MFFKDRFISLKEAAWLCKVLSVRLETYQIECVVSIESGGWFVGKHVSEYLDVPHVPITVRRFPSRSSCPSSSRFLVVQRFVSALWHDVLRASRAPQIIQGVPDPGAVKEKRVLLVDDAIHSGETIRVAREYLYRQGAMNVIVAALTSVQGFQPSFFCMLEGHRCYPWSKVSPEYDKFLALYRGAHE
jgi:hypoxanthine phosphoribosyltransferase